MKEQNFFRQLNRELDEAVPDISERLKNEPIRTARPQTADSVRPETPKKTEADKRTRRNKRLWGILGAAAAAVVVFAAVLTPFLSGSPATAPSARSCMYIDINPSLALTLDENYKVVKAVSRNADADTLTTDESFISALVGKNAASAAVTVAEQAAKKGYIKILNEGSAENYNSIGITLKSSVSVPEETLYGIKNELVGYFCENGLYVYVDATAETDSDTETLITEYENRPADYFAQMAEGASREELEALTKQAFCDYAGTLLTDALRKYDLFEEIQSINGQIESDPENTWKRSYWTVDEKTSSDNVRALSSEMEKRLDELYLLYGVDCREKSLESSVTFTLAYRTCKDSAAAADIDALRELEKNGIDENTFGGLQNLSVRVNYFLFVSNDILNAIVTDLWSDAIVSAEKLSSDIKQLVSDRAEALSERYSVLFEQPREQITEDNYREFLKRIGK